MDKQSNTVYSRAKPETKCVTRKPKKQTNTVYSRALPETKSDSRTKVVMIEEDVQLRKRGRPISIKPNETRESDEESD